MSTLSCDGAIIMMAIAVNIDKKYDDEKYKMLVTACNSHGKERA